MAARKPDFFTRFTTNASIALGRPWIFAGAIMLLVIWCATGPFINFSDTWQLIINTSTTIVTFLMVFIIQNTQNRDNLAMNIKLDAIMDKLGVSENELFEAEDESDKRLEAKKDNIQKQSVTPTTAKKKKR